MNFMRTNTGMSNLHLFHGVDAVVFVEGGTTTLTVDQLSQGLYNSEASDIKYWQIVFRAFAAHKTFHFRAVGSKNTINEITDLIATSKVKHVLVARDRDFDHLTGALSAGPGIFSTFGYSWENDVWTAPIVFVTFKKFSSIPDKETEAQKLIDSEFTKVCKKLRGCVRADAILSFNKLEPIPRNDFLKVVRPNRGGPPTIPHDAVKTLVRERRLKTRPQRLLGPTTKQSTLRDCYGHLLESFGYHLLVHTLKKFCGFKTTPKELLVPAAIDSFASALNLNQTLSTHYNAMFALLSW